MKWLIAILSCSAWAGDGLSPELKTLWVDLVAINSGTENLEGLQAVRQKLIPEFEKLGFKTQILDAGEGHKVLAFRFPKSKPQLALVGHIDTVFGKESPFQKPVLEGEWLHGPGAQDMKGGLVLMLDTLKQIKDPKRLKQIVVLLNDDEETGSALSRSLLKEQTYGAKYALVYEGPVTAPDSVAVSESGVNWIELKVRGQASHVGVAHDEGINACVELGAKLVQIAKLTDYNRGLTVNPGVITGGTKPNVVCDEARAQIDIRFSNAKDLARTRRAIDRIAGHSSIYNPKLKRGTDADIRDLLTIPNLEESATQELFQIAKEEAKKLGRELKGEHVGGVSDGNQLASTGLKILVGMGVYGQNPHTYQERADLASFERRRELNVALIKRLIP